MTQLYHQLVCSIRNAKANMCINDTPHVVHGRLPSSYPDELYPWPNKDVPACSSGTFLTYRGALWRTVRTAKTLVICVISDSVEIPTVPFFVPPKFHLNFRLKFRLFCLYSVFPGGTLSGRVGARVAPGSCQTAMRSRNLS